MQGGSASFLPAPKPNCKQGAGAAANGPALCPAPAHPQLEEPGGAHGPFLSAALTSAPSRSSRRRHGNRSGSSLARSRGLLSWICKTVKNS